MLADGFPYEFEWQQISSCFFVLFMFVLYVLFPVAVISLPFMSSSRLYQFINAILNADKSFCCIAMTNYTNTKFIYIYIYIRMNLNDTMKTSDTVLRKIYLSLYWKDCVWEGVGDRTVLQHIDPPLLLPSAFLSRSPGQLNRGPGGPASLGYVPQCNIFSPTGLISKLLNRGPEGSFC